MDFGLLIDYLNKNYKNNNNDSKKNKFFSIKK